MSSGKGDSRRPKSISYDEWSKRYEDVFKKKESVKKTDKKNDC